MLMKNLSIKEDFKYTGDRQRIMHYDTLTKGTVYKRLFQVPRLHLQSTHPLPLPHSQKSSVQPSDV